MRAAHHCALPDMDVSTWTGERAYSVYMGAPEDYSRSGESRSMGNDWTMPHEDPYEMGCPGAWYRSPFVLSLMRFYRDRDQQGNRIANPALDHCEDPLVHEAIVLLERYEESAIGEWLYQIHARRNQ